VADAAAAPSGPAFRAADLRVTAILYILTTLSMATVGVIVPFMGVISTRIGASPAQLGLAISLFSLPSALLAMMGGALIDRIGVRRSLALAGVVAVLGDLVLVNAPALWGIHMGLLLAGVAFAGISVAAPAAMVEMMEGPARVRAMSFWSTYAPTGYALGLLMAVPFGADVAWQGAVLVHLAIIGAATLLVPLLPARTAASGTVARRGSPFALLADPAIVRLAIAVALPNAISYGVSLVAPSYLARVHDVGLALSSGTVAAAKIAAMMLGGVLIGHLLARNLSFRRLYVGLALGGIAAQLLLFHPATPFAVAALALLAWLFAFGGMAGAAMAQLPVLIRDPANTGLASGLVGQFISLASFAAPPVYFGLVDWHAYWAIALVGLLVAIVVLPRAPVRD